MSLADPTPAPASRTSEWAALLFVPVVAFLIGGVFLPRPLPAEVERRTMDRSDLDGAVSKTRPTPGTPADVQLDDSLRFLGSDVPAEVSQGSRAAIDFHFEVLKELDRDWQMFVHIDRRDGPYRIHGDHFPVEGRYQTSLWQQGEFVKDHFVKLIPFDAPPGTYDVWIGFYIGDDRLPFSGGDAALHDGDNRIRAGVLKVR